MYSTVFYFLSLPSVFCPQQIKLALVICMRVWSVCVCQSPVRIRCHFHFHLLLFIFIFALFVFYFLPIFSSHFYLCSSLSAKNSCSSQASDSYAFQLFYHPPTVCVWNVPRGMLLVARSSLSCLLFNLEHAYAMCASV